MTDTPVTRAGNDQTVRLTEWLVMNGCLDEDNEPQMMEDFGDFADQLLARHRAQSEPSGEASHPQNELREALQDVKNWLIRYLGYDSAVSPLAKIDSILAKQERGT